MSPSPLRFRSPKSFRQELTNQRTLRVRTPLHGFPLQILLAFDFPPKVGCSCPSGKFFRELLERLSAAPLWTAPSAGCSSTTRQSAAQSLHSRNVDRSFSPLRRPHRHLSFSTSVTSFLRDPWQTILFSPDVGYDPSPGVAPSPRLVPFVGAQTRRFPFPLRHLLGPSLFSWSPSTPPTLKNPSPPRVKLLSFFQRSTPLVHRVFLFHRPPAEAHTPVLPLRPGLLPAPAHGA